MMQIKKTTRSIYVKLQTPSTAFDETLEQFKKARLNIVNPVPAVVVGTSVCPALSLMLESAAIEREVKCLSKLAGAGLVDVCFKGAPKTTMCFYAICLGKMEDLAGQWETAMKLTQEKFGDVIECCIHQVDRNFSYLTASFRPDKDCNSYKDDCRRYEKWYDQMMCMCSLLRIRNYHMVLTGLAN